ncbi:MAG: efflux RND transporter periplasmic adaptor subunit [Planctomycetota bacterium]
MKRRELGTVAILVALAAAAAGGEAASAPRVRAVVKPSHEIEVASPVGGIIEAVRVKEGDRVEKGQPLVQLESAVQRAVVAISAHKAESTARIEAAQANVRAKQVAYKRQKTLQAKGVAPDADVEEAELELAYAESQLVVAREEQALHGLEVARDRAALDRLTIEAPMAAVVKTRLRDPGEAAQEFEPLLELVVLDPLHVIAHCPRGHAGALKPGAEAHLVLDDQPDRRYACRVLVVDPVIDAASGTCRVKLELPNPDGQVAAGARAAVVFDVPDARSTEER